MNLFKHNQPFTLESGEQLPEIEIAYHSYGELNSDHSNVVWVCHALTANSDVADWWSGLYGKGKALDPSRYFIVCANVIGGCYGSTGPLSENSATQRYFYHDFPTLSIRDLVKAHQLLARELGVTQIAALIGGSLGGQQALEWSISEPERFDKLVLLATNAQHSPWGIAFNEAQRLAIEADQTWLSQRENAGKAGMVAARAAALLSYRNYSAFALSQAETNDQIKQDFKAASYQQYQGEKLAKRFNAFSYYRLSQAMDSHNVGRDRESIPSALSSIQAITQIIGIDSDVLFPPSEQRFLHRHIPLGELHIIPSAFGHDGFLVETNAIGKRMQAFLNAPTTNQLINTTTSPALKNTNEAKADCQKQENKPTYEAA